MGVEREKGAERESNSLYFPLLGSKLVTIEVSRYVILTVDFRV